MDSTFLLDRTVIRFTSPHSGLAAFVREMLHAHAYQGTRTADLHVTVRAFLSWPFRGRTRADASQSPPAGAIRLDTTVARTGTVTYYNTPRVSIGLSMDEGTGQSTVSGSYFERFDHSFRRFLDPQVRANNFQVALRTFLLRPFFLHEELRFGVNPLHAAVVRGERATLLILGLSGVGKSTLAAGLAARFGWTLISDNYAGHDEQHVFGIHEPMRLSAQTIALLGRQNLDRIAVRSETAFGTRASFMLRDPSRAPIRPTHAIVLGRGPDFHVEPLSIGGMANTIHRLNGFLNEFHFNSFEELAYDFEVPSVERRMQRTKYFLEGMRLHSVTVSRDDSLDLTLSRLQDALQLS